MKTRIALLTLLLIVPGAASAQGAKLELKGLDRLAKLAEETVNLDIPSGMLAFAGAFLNDDADQAVAKQLLSNLKGIYIRSFEFARENAYTADDVDNIRKQLSAPGWSKFVS